jgi:dipeptidyl-peptidase 4
MGAEVAITADGMRVYHLHDGELRVCEIPSGQVQQLAVGVDDYGADRTGRLVVWTNAGVLHRRDAAGVVSKLPTPGEVRLARPDPGGRRIAYLCQSALRVVREDGNDVLLAGEEAVVWGACDPAAAYFGRDAGFWWSPDGETVLATRTHHEQVSLHLLDVDGGWVDVHWDREVYPYLGIVTWADGSPLITVLRRSQAHGLVLAVDRRTGETQVHAELADPRWVHPIAGTPRHLADGRVLVGGEIAHDGYDARCLFADGTLLTPPGLYVRRVVGRLGPRAAGGELGDMLVEASEGEPSEQHLYRVRGTSSGAMLVHRITATPGWHTAICAGDTVVAGYRTWTSDDTQWIVLHAGIEIAELTGLTEVTSARPAVERVTDRKLPTAVLYPPGHIFGRRLPVVLLLPDSPARQQVRAGYPGYGQARRLVKAGFAVVMVDGRGTHGISPGFEKVIHRRLADLAPADHLDALRAIAEKHPDLDLGRVVAVGSEYGGWLAAMLAAHRPDAIQGAVAHRPWDWTRLQIPLAERYLGPLEQDSEIYARHEVGPLPATVLELSTMDDAAALSWLNTFAQVR